MWSWFGRPRMPRSIGDYENVVPFPGREGFYAATRVFSAEATIHSFLLQVVPESDKEACTRLLFMSRRLSKLDSRYIPQACDLGMNGGWRYMALQLKEPMEIISTPRADGLEICRQLAAALSYLHDQGFAHRALMPSTIGITPSGTPLLYDLWWMSHFHGDRMVPAVVGRRNRTRYDAPEAGDERFDGVRADIYSLGVVAEDLALPSQYSGLLERMRRPMRSERPSSMQAVLDGLT